MNTFSIQNTQKTLIRPFVLSLVMITSCFAFSQRVEWGASTKTKEFPVATFDLDLVDGQYCYILANATEKDRHHLMKLDQQMQLVDKVPLPGFKLRTIIAWANNDDIFISGALLVKGKLKSKRVDQKTGAAAETIEQYNPIDQNMMPICTNTGLNSERIGIFAIKPDGRVNANMILRANRFTKGKQSVALTPLSDVKAKLMFFDAKFNAISDIDFSIPKKHKNLRIVGATFDQNGDVFFAIRGSDGKQDGELRIYKKAGDESTLEEIDRLNDVGAIRQIDLKIENRMLVWGGMSKNAKGKNGVFYGKYNLEEGSLSSPTKKYRLRGDDINKITIKKPNKTETIKDDFILVNTLFTEDDGVVYVIENRENSTTGYANIGMPLGMRSSPGESNGTVFNEVVIMKCDKNNHPLWIKRLERKQRVSTSFTFAFGVFSVLLNDEIHILYNEKVNDGELKAFVFDINGEMKTTSIHNIGKTKKAIVPNFCSKKPNGDVVLLTFGWGGIINFGRYYAN